MRPQRKKKKKRKEKKNRAASISEITTFVVFEIWLATPRQLSTFAMPKKISAAATSKPAKPAQATATDIDDIFAKPKVSKSKPESVVEPEKKKSKGKSKAVSAEEPAAAPINTEGGEKKKTVTAFVPNEDGQESSSKVETVVDPSTIPIVIPEPPVTTKTKKDKGTKRDRKEDEDDEIFRDSRGTGPSKSALHDSYCFSDLQFEGRKTEEGFLIYKEAELKIDPEAGGTPLCPFDCDCCKFIGF